MGYILLNRIIGDHFHVGTAHDRRPRLPITLHFYSRMTLNYCITIPVYWYKLVYRLSLCNQGVPPVCTHPCCRGSNKHGTQLLIDARLNAKKVVRSGEREWG
jgi:hypothetical protein